MRNAWPLFIVALLGIAGCSSSSVPLMNTPVVYEDQRVDVFQHVPPQKQSTTLDVFYCTERGASGPADNRHYNNSMTDQLRLGEATVRFGDDKTTWPQIVEASTSHDRKKSIGTKVTRATEVGTLPAADAHKPMSDLSDGERKFVNDINAALADAPHPEISIYVHGFRVSFDEVAVSAQLRHYLGREQVVIAYAWPCRQGVLEYNGDFERAMKCGGDLATLIAFLADHTKAEHINVLGYSAGAVLVAEGIVELRERHPDLDERALQEKLRVGNVVLVGADVDLERFVEHQIEEMTQVARSLQVTISHGDQALGLSSVMHGGKSRLGSGLSQAQLEDVAKHTKLNIIDVTNVKGPHSEGGGIAGHGYWYANPWISSDILTLLVWQLSPDARGLEKEPIEHAWDFPNDYPNRVHAVVRDRIIPIEQSHATTRATAERDGATAVP